MKRSVFFSMLIGCFGLMGCSDEGAVIFPSSGDWDSSPTSKDENEDAQTSEQTDKSQDGSQETPDNDEKTDSLENADKPGAGSSGATDSDGCDPACKEDENCIEHVCLPICSDGTFCNGECLDLAALHLADCNTCAEDYCDSNQNPADGCDIYVKGDDNNNCGACGKVCQEGTKCKSGSCESECGEWESFCNGSCLKLADLHLSSCDSCAEGYCDTDGNLANGCEVNSKGNDVSNCGACGNVCNGGEVCENGSCKVPYESHRMIVVGLDGDTLMVRTGPGTENQDIGELHEYQYITVLEEKNGWYRHNFNGQDGWSSGSYLMDACDKCEGRKAIDYAEQFLYDYSTRLCTWDHLTHEPIIENFTDLWADYHYYNHGYNDNCANFVTACLNTVGLMSQHYIAVDDIGYHCDANKGGWRKVSFSSAKAGDIWVSSGGGHTELVVGYKDDIVYLIGSNNFDSSNFGGCQVDTGAGGSSYQRVSYAAKTAGSTGYICSRQ